MDITDVVVTSLFIDSDTVGYSDSTLTDCLLLWFFRGNSGPTAQREGPSSNRHWHGVGIQR